MATDITTTDSTRNAAEIYRYYRQTIKTWDELRRIASHLRGFMEIADRNDRELVVEIWLRQKGGTTS